jgi:site-specific DNA-methyltransferase (adenine-specific)
VIEREKAEIGVLICMESPTKQMRAEATEAGLYEAVWGKRYHHLQILTIEELLKGKKVDYPPSSRHLDVTFKKAPKAIGKGEEQVELPFSKKN